MPDPTITERAARNRERERREGMVRVEVRVPADRADELRRIAGQMRDEWRATRDGEET